MLYWKLIHYDWSHDFWCKGNRNNIFHVRGRYVIKVMKLVITRLHSSRMRTAHALTVSPSMLCAGGCLFWGVSAWGGSARGVSAQGVSARRCLLRGVSAWGGFCSGGYPSMHWGRPPLWTEWQTGAKILPCLKLRLRAVKISFFIVYEFIKVKRVNNWKLQCHSQGYPLAVNIYVLWTHLKKYCLWHSKWRFLPIIFNRQV